MQVNSGVVNLINELEEEYPDSLLAVKDMKHDDRITYIAKLELIEYMKLKLEMKEKK